MGFLVAGQQAPQQSILGGFRLAAARLGGYYPHVVITINGTTRTTSCRIDSLSITEYEGGTPNEARLRVSGFVPSYGHEIKIGIQTITPSTALVFAGHIIGIDQITEAGDAANVAYDLTCLDYTWFLNRRKVSKQYLSQSATAILQDLIDTFTSGFTYTNVEPGLTTIDEITFTNEDVSDAIDRVMKRIGGYWKMDYGSDLHAFLTAGESAGSVTDAAPRTAEIDSFQITRDLSQVRTRYFGEGMGSQLMAACAAGETRIPVDDTVAFNAAGGKAKVGYQLLTYTGKTQGGGGGLVGPGAAPSTALAVALANGAGVESGAHSYGVTFVTASGESIVSPLAAITTGMVEAPTSAPSAGTPTIGTGPNPGSHDYAVTFVTASGETTPGSSATKATTLTAEPGTYPIPGTPTFGGSVDAGTHDYVLTFVTSIGETTPSQTNGDVTTIIIADPTVAIADGDMTGKFSNMGEPHPFASGGGPWTWAYTFVTEGGGETLPSPTTSCGVLGGGGPFYAIVTPIPIGGTGVTSRKLYRTVDGGSQLKLLATIDNVVTSYSDHIYDEDLGANAPTVSTAKLQTIPLTEISTGDANVTSRKLYRRFNHAGTFKLVTTIANNSATTYSDTTANVSLGADVPSVSTAYIQRIPLTAIPIGSALVTQRKIYRTEADGSQLKLADTIADNTTTTWTDTVTDASLGADVPETNTATANQVALSSVPIGTAAVTSRKIYRTVAGGAQLKLQQTIADNVTTTGVTDSTADASLGADVPTSDASGLMQPDGQVNAGSTPIIVAGTAAFSASGGWAVIGNGQQVIRYTGITSVSLTGIPASGAGAIVATVAYNSTITAAPMLTGIPASGTGAILDDIIEAHAEINLVVQRDDATRQAALAAKTGGDGIVEDWIQDRRLSEDEMTARCDAALELNGDPVVTVAWTTRDPSVKAARNVTFSLAAPTSLSESALKIQRVTIGRFGVNPTIWPWRRAEASSTRYSFEDLVRQIKGR